MFEGNEDYNVEGSSLVNILWVEFGTEVGPCDRIPYERDIVKMDGLGER